MLKNIKTFGGMLVCAALLWSCGENSSSEKVVQIENSSVETVEKIADLPKCTADNEGVQVFVKSESAIRICSDGDWFGIIDDNGGSDLNCSTEKLADSTGVKILCYGDSVGVVYNGKDGAQGERGESGATGATGEKDATGSADPGCTVVTLVDNSGLKVLCSGDSVGVVLNGEKGDAGDAFERSDYTDEQLDALKGDKGSDGDKGDKGQRGDTGNGLPGVSCNLVDKDCIIHAACGKDTVSLDIYSTAESCVKTVELDSEAIALNLEGIGGSSQKGPFLTGSEVVVNELLNGRTLSQTGNTFVGKILSDKGDFDIRTVSLASQYATLSVKGYYLNEVTGLPSNSQITLNALTNLRGRAVANINLLTHLENERAQYLVLNNKMSVAGAKKKAETEVFKLFHIDASKFSGYSEDLNVLGSSDADAALLAMSILLQGNRSEAELSALLTTISKSMEKSGSWDDESAKVAIADWAADADTAGLLTKFRENVTNWGISHVVAKFEPYFRNYWNKTLGLEFCTSENVGVVAQPTVGARSGSSRSRFTCVDSSDVDVGTVWRVSTDLEKDTYGWKSGEDGESADGTVTGLKYVYDAEGSENRKPGWRLADEFEQLFGACATGMYGAIRTYRGAKNPGFYQCQKKTRKWVETMDYFAVDTQGWEPKSDGYASLGDSVCVIERFQDLESKEWYRICYVYDESLSPAGYRVGGFNDCYLGFGGCTKSVQSQGKMNCKNSSECYMCRDNEWIEVKDADVISDTRDLTCNNDGELINKESWDYVCDDGLWRKTSQSDYDACHENNYCNVCVKSLQGKFETRNGVEYVCDNREWRTPNEVEHEKQSLCVDEIDGGEIFFGPTMDWVCKENSWQVTSMLDYNLEQWRKHVEIRVPEGVTFGRIRDERDGNSYRIVKIGNLVWMAENLAYAKKDSTLNLKGNSWCYENDTAYCNIMGLYYTWTAAMDFNESFQTNSAASLIKTPHRGICPEGWHIPTMDEFKNMKTETATHTAQKSAGIGTWTDGTNTSGFSGIPSSYRNRYGYFTEGNRYAMYWTATEGTNAALNAEYWILGPTDSYSYDGGFLKEVGHSIRCVCDKNELSLCSNSEEE